MTSRHLAEFWMLEVEWAFVDCVRDVCDLVQAAAQSVLRDALLSPRSEDIDLLWRSNEERGVEGSRARRRMLEDSARTDAPWTRMTYTDAIKALQDHYQYAGPSTPKFEFEPAWGRALQSEHERWLAEHFVRGPVFVTDYPASLKPFYMRANDDGPVDGAGRRTVACFDLLVPHVGELVGGSLREHRADVLSSVMAAAGLDGRDYEWYLDLRRFGRARSGGFGMGFERLIGWLGGIDNVRECIAMPRWNGRMLL
jgi:asparaginyl-tRNA synthetase